MISIRRANVALGYEAEYRCDVISGVRVTCFEPWGWERVAIFDGEGAYVGTFVASSDPPDMELVARAYLEVKNAS